VADLRFLYGQQDDAARISFQPLKVRLQLGDWGSAGTITAMSSSRSDRIHYRNATAYIYRRIAVLRWCRNCGGFAVKLRVAVGYLMSSHCFIRFWVISPLLCMCENVVSAWRSLTFATFIILVIASL
jgi:hypothetical protein